MVKSTGYVYLLGVVATINLINYLSYAFLTSLATNPTFLLFITIALYIPFVALALYLRGENIAAEILNNPYFSLTRTWGYVGVSLMLGSLIGAIALLSVAGVQGANPLDYFKYTANPNIVVSKNEAVSMAFASLLVVGPSEELIFRGLLYGALLDSNKWRNWKRLNFIQALGFGLSHLYYLFFLGLGSLVVISAIAGMGYGLGWAYYRSGGGLTGPIVVHGVWDASAFLTLYSGTLVLGSTGRVIIFVLMFISALYLVSTKRVRQRPSTHPEGSGF
jgi:membrane protease YdiL (CAAX protease family)